MPGASLFCTANASEGATAGSPQARLWMVMFMPAGGGGRASALLVSLWAAMGRGVGFWTLAVGCVLVGTGGGGESE